MANTHLPASVNDCNTQQFVGLLKQQPVRPPRGVKQPEYSFGDGCITVVNTIDCGYPDNTCWFNVVDYCCHSSSGAVPVFGWAIWVVPEQPNKYVAQHHAVAYECAKFVDVTLAKLFKHITFIPDSRAPFDFDALRYPFNFEHGQAGDLWYATGCEQTAFSIARMQPLESELGRIKNIVKLGRNRGVI